MVFLYSGFTSLSNTFQVISGWRLLVTEGIKPLYDDVSLKYHTTDSHIMISIICRAFDKGSLTHSLRVYHDHGTPL